MGRYFRTCGKVRNNFNIASWKPAPEFSLRFFIKLAMTLLDCPNWAIEKLPNLFKRITWGIEGKMIAASNLSRWGLTAATTLSAKSSIKMRDAMKILALATSS